jgi:quinol-cytochrome oxidoreductase complex cytochrome b subunit
MNGKMGERIKSMIVRSRIWRSVFRHGAPLTGRNKALTMFTNFFLHIMPTKVQKHALRPTYTLGLGVISFILFWVLVVTGVFLMLYYVPTTSNFNGAYDSIKDIQFSVSYGRLMRNVHRWAAHLMVASVFFHMCRVFYTGAYKPPREFNWIIGVILLLLTLLLSFTGYLLPWDQLAFWAIQVGTNIPNSAPVFGPMIRYVLLGGHEVGQGALTRFYALHIFILPLLLMILLGVHLWRVRKDGGLSRPGELWRDVPPFDDAQGGPERVEGPEGYSHE